MDCAGYEEQFTSKYNETDNNQTDILLQKPKGKNYLHWYQKYLNQSIKVKQNDILILKWEEINYSIYMIKDMDPQRLQEYNKTPSVRNR